MQAQIKKITLTSEGIAKFKNFAEIAKTKLSDLLQELESQIKDTISKYAPSEDGELYQLALPGTTYNIFKNGFLSLQKAIQAEVVPIEATNNRVFALYGDPDKMNPQIGFVWFKNIDGRAEKRSTADAAAGEAWSSLLQKWELGGSFTVISREEGGMLTIAMQGKNPVRVESVLKTIPAYAMYATGGRESKQILLENAKNTLKDSLAEAGFITG